MGGVAPATTTAGGLQGSPGGDNAAGSRGSSFELQVGQLVGQQPLVLSLLPPSLEKLSVQGYVLLLDAPAAQQQVRASGPNSSTGGSWVEASYSNTGAGVGGSSGVAGATSAVPDAPNANGSVSSTHSLQSATTSSNSGSGSSGNAGGGRQGPVMSRLQELELEECAATDGLLLRLLQQATSLKRLQLRGEGHSPAGVCLVCAWCVPGVCLVCAWCVSESSWSVGGCVVWRCWLQTAVTCAAHGTNAMQSKHPGAIRGSGRRTGTIFMQSHSAEAMKAGGRVTLRMTVHDSLPAMMLTVHCVPTVYCVYQRPQGRHS
jgi:hypothetical protein